MIRDYRNYVAPGAYPPVFPHSSPKIYRPEMITINDIGIPGKLGFGVGICPYDSALPGFNDLEGTGDKHSDNYGNYQYQDGSIMVWIPKFYYKIGTGSNGLDVNVIDIKGIYDFATRAAAEAQGYALHRAFIDGGAVKDGFFIDKYMCSKKAWGAGYIASSVKNGLPISTHNDHNRIIDLTACSSNYYWQTLNAAHARDGVDGAINPNSNFSVVSRFMQSALAMLSMAHGQAASNTENCAWFLANKNYPKGCNNNALHDCDDGSVSYVSDGYSNCGKTGSGVPFAKTTHNGQASGVADLNGLMWEIQLGITRPGASAGDTAQQNDTTKFFILKEAIALKKLTSGWSNVDGVDNYEAWGTEAHLDDLYDQITIAHIGSGAGWVRFGNGANQVLSEAISGDNYKLAGIGIYKDANGKSAGGTNLFGVDGSYEYHRANLCVLSCAYWFFGSYAGVWGVLWHSCRTDAHYGVGLRAACYPV